MVIKKWKNFKVEKAAVLSAGLARWSDKPVAILFPGRERNNKRSANTYTHTHTNGQPREDEREEGALR